jgi:hypothetical protein
MGTADFVELEDCGGALTENPQARDQVGTAAMTYDYAVLS